MPQVADVVVVGAGLAGLACALHLTRAGVDVALLEAAEQVGGRVATDQVDGMLLDRGFQVYNTAYPEAARLLDHDALDLRPFVRGALVRYGDKLHRLADPTRKPTWALSGATAPIASPKDKAAILALAARAVLLPVDRLTAATERTTREHLRAHGIGDRAVERFLRPFLSGVFLDDDLTTSSHLFDVVLRAFVRGTQAVPAAGMRAIPEQLAAQLPGGVLRLGNRLAELPTARAVVVATDPATAAALLDLPTPSFGSVTTHYHLADAAPVQEAVVVLDGERSGPVANTVVLTNVAPSYAPGRVLISSSVVTGDAAEPAVRAHLQRIYGVDTASWQHVSTYALPQALPSMAPPLGNLRKPVRIRDGVFVAGDHRDTASIQGALVSGRRAAVAVLKELRG